MKREKDGKNGPPSPEAGVWQSPEFKALSAGLGTILSVPKEKVDAILREEKTARGTDRQAAK